MKGIKFTWLGLIYAGLVGIWSFVFCVISGAFTLTEASIFLAVGYTASWLSHAVGYGACLEDIGDEKSKEAFPGAEVTGVE